MAFLAVFCMLFAIIYEAFRNRKRKKAQALVFFHSK